MVPRCAQLSSGILTRPRGHTGLPTSQLSCHLHIVPAEASHPTSHRPANTPEPLAPAPQRVTLASSGLLYSNYSGHKILSCMTLQSSTPSPPPLILFSPQNSLKYPLTVKLAVNVSNVRTHSRLPRAGMGQWGRQISNISCSWMKLGTP